MTWSDYLSIAFVVLVFVVLALPLAPADSWFWGDR